MTQTPFDTDALRRFRRIFLMTRRRGDLIDRLEHRGYASGDDYRCVDWRLCARRDELLTRTPVAHQDVSRYILLDCSASMAIGDPSKFTLAQTVAAMAAYRALADFNRCGVSAFAGQLAADLPSIRGASRIGKVLRFLESLSPQGEHTDLPHTAQAFVRRYQPHGTATVITDCHDRTGCVRGLQILAARGYKPQLVHIYASCEADPRLLGDVELFDVESGRTSCAVITERTATRYRRRFAEFCGSIRNECSRRGIPCLQVASSAPQNDVLQSVLRLESL